MDAEATYNPVEHLRFKIWLMNTPLGWENETREH